MSGDVLPSYGEIWWIRADKRRPAVVVQTNHVRQPRVRSFLVAPLTSRLHVAELPGNVRLSSKATRLQKASVANLYDIQKVFLPDFRQRLASLPAAESDALRAGLRVIFDL